MKVFITGATGWVGSAVVKDLLAHGHQVIGLARSAEKAEALGAAGAKVLLGSLDDLETLRATAAACDAVIHTAFNHDDFTRFAESAEQERRVVDTFGAAFEGLGRVLIVTSGVALLAPGRLATEQDVRAPDSFPRKAEEGARAWAGRGVRAACIRLAPTVHGPGDQGFVAMLIQLARTKGVSGYIGDGQNHWPAVHRLDAARLYRHVLERRAPEVAYHAIAEEGIPFRQIAERIGRRLGLPCEPRETEHFGWFGPFVGADIRASSAHTQAALGWKPFGPGLLADLDPPGYFGA